MKRKVVLLKESTNVKRVHPLNADQLKGVMGGVTANPIPVPIPVPQPPGATGPTAPDRDWGWW
jgi:hypothetical protein